MAIYSGLYNVGIGGGTSLGKMVTTSYGLSQIGIVGGLVAVIGTVLTFILVQGKDLIKV